MYFCLVSVSFGADVELQRLVISTTQYGEVEFEIEIANTVESRQQGLMFRKELAPDAGMLFDYKYSRHVSFWMKNTLIPLDILFINSTGEIVIIRQNAKPHSLELIPSGEPVRAVLEVNAGIVEKYLIKPGDRVQHPIFE